ncbi:MAG: S9 family peptidase [Acidobacteria bacterium]|nr:S9 family peptidase [Acidobacteriota bacterium]
MVLDDFNRIVALGDPQRSPDGDWVAYTVTTIDAEKDRRNTDIWMARWDGTAQQQLTSSPDGESSPRWSPDGKYLAFLASRGTEDEKKQGAQLWLLPRQGGEALKVSEVKGGLSNIQWSPDSTRIAFEIADVNPADEPEKMEGWKRKTTPPIVIDRYHFKEDRTGYLTRHYSHIAVFDLATKTATTLTSGQVDDENPAWSPDGTRIAFISKRAQPDPDRTTNTDVWVIDAKPGATPRQMTNTPEGESGRPTWSPDGSRIAVLVGDTDTNYAYDLNKLGVIAANAPGPGAVRLLSPTLDRAVFAPSWSKDGQRISFLLEDDRSQHAASVPAEGGTPRRLTGAGMVVAALSPNGADDRHAAVLSTSNTLPELFALDGGAPRQLTRHNAALQAEVRFATAENLTSKSKDGTEVHSILVKPVDYVAGRAYPTILFIHGGPNGQDDHGFDVTHQWFAANGYVVLAPNYRGSSGRGATFQKAIHKDWGHFEVVDVLGAVDEAVKQGVADPNRLGIGGWSYGGITTNYTIATDTRFKAAASGAGSSLQLTMYGMDRYIVQYEQELGLPWKNPEAWMKVSYPFFHADRIRTPTLFLGGEKDFNVPIAGGEQMYQALRSQNVDTELVIYPGQFHGLTVPSYERDRLQRYANWYGKYLQPAAPTSARQP